MIQKLRMKFIGIFMGSLMLVIVLVMGLLNFLNYREAIQSADNILDILAENDGSFPPPRQPEDMEIREAPQEENTESTSEGTSGETSEESPQEAPEGRREIFHGRGWLSPETPYETRFFVVSLNEDGEILSTDTGKIAAVDEETAKDYAEKIWDSQRTQGFVSQYRYRLQETDEGFLAIFLDCSRNLQACRSVLLTSAGVSILGILLVFGLVFFFSGMVMKPVYESYEKQKRFITDAGHEIKTPLTILGADMDVLGMEIGENEWLEDMRRQNQRLTVLTNDLIYLARMEEGTSKLQMIELPFSDLVEETAQSFQALAIVEKKFFHLQIQPMVMLRGDEQGLRKLVSILLDNAVKYSEENGSITLSLEKTGRMVRLSVENTAEGISKETVSHLFERFYRADASRNSRKGGYGIGLSIAEAIVLAHKGEIKASVQEGQSLKITVLLPAKEWTKERA